MAKRGRKTKYKKIYCKRIVDFFQESSTIERQVKEKTTKTLSNGSVYTTEKYEYFSGKLPTFEGFAESIGVHRDTVLEWSQATKGTKGKLKYPEFSVAYNKAKQIQKEWLIDIGLKGLAPPASFIFVAKNVTDMTDKQEVDHTSKGEKIIGFNYQPPAGLIDETDNADNQANS